MQGNDAKVTNAGSINVLDDAPAILAQGDRATITNSGVIVGGNNSMGMVVFGDSNTITNRGTITVGAGFAAGIDVASFFGQQ